jgi:membrane protein DedA with SNARE-associated domain
MNIKSVFWAITLTLFLGAMGLPIPENPVLMGGGYAIFKKISPPMASLGIWYFAIWLGDAILFGVAYWFFTRPGMARFLTRYVGKKRFQAYRLAFAAKGGWTLFLARFTFGIRAVAYVAAGAAHYSWKRFLVVDGISVAIQVLLFVGIGYFAGEKIDWAQDTGEKLVLILGLLALITLIITWICTYLLRKSTPPAPSK